MKRNAPTVISLFAGCGGSSLGYKAAGFRELLAIDWDKNSEKTFKLNFPEVPFWNQDIAKVKPEQILKACLLGKGELDVLDGSPPCQGFSTSGKRQVADPRNGLFGEYVRLLRGLRPKAFVMENVAGMARGVMRGIFREAMRELRKSGYRVGCRLMNARYHGVAQNRPRLFFVGVRNDLGRAPAFPKPSGKVPTIAQAIRGVEPKTFKPLPKGIARSIWRSMRLGQCGKDVAGYGQYRDFWKLDPARPSNAVLKTVAANHPTFFSGLAHWSEPRFMSIEELKRIASFPDSFQLVGSFEEQWARIGNAVMPRMMEAVARAVRREVLRC